MALSEAQLNSLTSLLGKEYVRQPDNPSAPVSVFPENIEQVQEALRFCASRHLTVSPNGSYTNTWQRSLVSYDISISVSRLNHVDEYQTENLVIATGGGLRGRDIVSVVEPNGHIVPLDPAGFSDSTMASVVSRRAAGPARYRHGTPRDCVMGMKIVNAKGELIRAGSRVVKNVAGYDLCKLYTGSWGTLGVIVETVFLLWPKPLLSESCVSGVSTLEQADKLAASVMNSDIQPRTLDALNAKAVRRLPGISDFKNRYAVVVIFDGTREQIDCMKSEFQELSSRCGADSMTTSESQWNSEWSSALADVWVPADGGCVYEYAGLPGDLVSVVRKMEEAAESVGIDPVISSHAGNGVIRLTVDECHENLQEALTTKLIGFIPSNSSRSLTVRTRGRCADKVWLVTPSGIDIMRRIKSSLDPDNTFAAGGFAGGL